MTIDNFERGRIEAVKPVGEVCEFLGWKYLEFGLVENLPGFKKGWYIIHLPMGVAITNIPVVKIENAVKCVEEIVAMRNDWRVDLNNLSEMGNKEMVRILDKYIDLTRFHPTSTTREVNTPKERINGMGFE